MRPVPNNNDVSQDDVSLAAAQRLVAYEEAKARSNGAAADPSTDAPLHDLLAPDLACVDLLHRVWPDFDPPPLAPKESPPPIALGDFQIIREIGRGGMGVVYEAQQLSLHRRVALKVLPFAAVLDQRNLQRFKNEALAAATLDHSNIVSVYSVGEERGVYYYAMQLIRGQSLATMIGELRKVNRCREPRSTSPAQLVGLTAPSDNTRTIDSAVSMPAATKRDEQARASTAVDSRHAAEHYRSAARLGIQAAEALQHAHDQGVLHRDIKPSNLMLDAEGKLYVTDFGLARIEADAGMTMTGDIVGTLRYMAPEQALAKRVVIDHRADVYSLGATLYELLTLQPAFGETDRLELLKQIAFEEPIPLRKVDRCMPEDLETIVLKAMAKSPDDRYQTAQQLAADLVAYLDHRPIKARPPALWNRAAKWSRRHVGIVWTALAASLAGSAILAGSTALIAESRDEANDLRQIALEEKTNAIDQRNRAVDERNKSRLSQYYAQIVAGQVDVAQKNIGGLRGTLGGFLPVNGEPDLRDWEWYYLMSQCHPEVRTLRTLGAYWSAAWSPDGKMVGAPGNIWNSDSGEIVKSFEPSRNMQLQVAWSPDSQKFAWGVVSDDRAIFLWDRATSWNIPKRENGPNDNAIYLWDRATDAVDRLPVHGERSWTLEWSPDGRQLASATLDGSVEIKDVAMRSIVRTLTSVGQVKDLAWSPDASLLIAGIRGQGLRIWNPTTGELVAELPDGDQHVGMSWIPDGKLVAVASDRRWYLLNSHDWSIVKEHPLASGGAGISCSPDGRKLAMSDGESVTVWDLQTDQPIVELNGHMSSVRSVEWNFDGSRLLTASDDGEIKLWDPAVPQQPPAVDIGAPIDWITWLADPETLVAFSEQTDATYSWTGAETRPRRRSLPVVEHADAWTIGRRLVAVYHKDQHQISIIESTTGATRSVLRLPPDQVFNFCNLSLDGSRLAVVSNYGEQTVLSFWDTDTERLVSEAQISSWPFAPSFSMFAWDGTGSRFAFVGRGDPGDDIPAAWQDHLQVIDVQRGARVLSHCTTGGFQSQIAVLAWSPTAESIAIGTSDGRVEAVEITSKRVVFSEKVHRDAVFWLAWHPEGKRLACLCAGVVKLITAADGKVLMALPFADEKGVRVAWSADGQQLAAASSAGHVQTWDASRGYDLCGDRTRRGELAWTYYDRATGDATEGSGFALDKVLAIAPDNLGFWQLRGTARARLGQFDRAAEEFAKAISPVVGYSFVPSIDRCLCLLAAGDVEGYQKACASLVAEYGINNLHEPNKLDLAWLCAIGSNSSVDTKDMLAMVERVAEHSVANNLGSLTYGACLFRDGQLDQSIRGLMEFSDRLERGGVSANRYQLACADYFLAMARHKLGNEFQSRRCLNDAIAADDALQNDLTLDWTQRVVLDTLHREAKGLIDP